MEYDDVGATLKGLDDLDAKLFGCSLKKKEPDVKNNELFSKKATVDSEDFDVNSDDLDDILNDDVFPKKTAPKSPTKKPLKDESAIYLRNSNEEKQSNTFSSLKSDDSTSPKSVAKPIQKTSIKKTDSPQKKLTKGSSKADSDSSDESSLDDFNFGSKGIKNSTFLSELEKTSPDKKNLFKQDKFSNNETNFLEDLNVDQLSLATSSKNHTDDSLIKKAVDNGEGEGEVSEEEDDDFLKNLGLGFTNEKKKSSSPKKQSPLQFDKEKLSKTNIQNDGEDFLDGYIPSAKGDTFSPKKSEIEEPKKSIIPRRRRDSLIKQVSFTGIPEVSELDETTKATELLSSKKTLGLKSPKLQKQQSAHVEKDKDDTTEWLNFFNKSSAKDKPVEHAARKNFETRTDSKEIKDGLSNRRRSSSAEWLGITEPNLEVVTKRTDDKVVTLNSDWLNTNKLDKSQTDLTRTRTPWRQQDDNWLAGGDNSVNLTNQSSIKLDEQVSTIDSKANAGAKSILLDNVDHNHQNLTLGREQKIDFNPIPKTQDVVSKPINVAKSITTRLTSEFIPNSEQTATSSVSSHLPNYVDQQAFASLQLMLSNSTLQNEQLVKSSEAMKSTYEEKLRSIETLHKEQQKKSDDDLGIQINKLQEEYDVKFKKLERHLHDVEMEKKQSETSFRVKFDDLEKDHRREIQKLKELHSESITAMKQDHEDALLRLKKLKDQEVEAISSSQVYARSLQSLTDQLETRASELATLHSRIEEKNNATMHEKQAYLENKEKDLKVLQSRLQRQLEDGDEERIHLQQLVLRLESRLQKYTMEGEEDRWDVQQTKARLTVQQKYLEEEHKLKSSQIEREREKLQLSQNSLLHEQKTVLLQLAQERQQLTQEKIEFDSLSRRMKEDEARLNVRKLKEESSYESQRRLLQQEEDKLHLERSQVKQESYQFEREKEVLQREKQQLKDEKEKFNEFRLTIKRRADEVEEMAMSAAAEREQGQSAHAAARRIESEHHSRMQQFTQQMQLLMDKERQILLEKEKLAEERQQLESKKDSMTCHKCKLKIGFPVSYLHPGPNSSPQVPLPMMNGVTNAICHPHVDPSLFVWYITAQRDQEFLQEEMSFLHSLKDSGKSNKE